MIKAEKRKLKEEDMANKLVREQRIAYIQKIEIIKKQAEKHQKIQEVKEKQDVLITTRIQN